MGYGLIYIRPRAGKRVPLERDPGRYLDPAGQAVERNQHWLRRLAAGDVETCQPLVQQAAATAAPEAEPTTVKPARKRATTRGEQ